MPIVDPIIGMTLSSSQMELVQSWGLLGHSGRKRGHTNSHRFGTFSRNQPARAMLGDMTSSRGHPDDDPLCRLL
jgi:hypothetical protein